MGEWTSTFTIGVTYLRGSHLYPNQPLFVPNIDNNVVSNIDNNVVSNIDN